MTAGALTDAAAAAAAAANLPPADDSLPTAVEVATLCFMLETLQTPHS
jgi:hypothetical protein